MPSENMMAKDIHDLLTQQHGLNPERFRIYVCNQINHPIVVATGNAESKRMLPLYVPKTKECPTDQSRQVGRCDMVVVDMKEKRVWLTVEFEGETEPKELVANYFYIFMASVFKPEEGVVYKLKKDYSTHILIACLDRQRLDTPNEQAKVQQYRMLANAFQQMGSLLLNQYPGCSVKEAVVLSGDDWQAVKNKFSEFVKPRMSD